MTGYIRFNFTETLVHSNIFRLRLLRAFYDAWFAQNKLLTELNSPISAVYFRLQQFFNILISSDFAHILTLSFPMDVVTMVKTVCGYLFHLREIRKQTLGTFKKALFLSSESVNMLIRGVVKFLVPKKFMDKKGGVSRFSVETFLSHSAEKFSRGTL